MGSSKTELEPWRPPDHASFIDPFDDLALLGYYADVSKWHGYARFLGLPHLRENADQPLYELYVEPFLTRNPISPERRIDEWAPKALPLLSTVFEIPRLVILGDPGSGKSTLVSWIAWQLAQSQSGPWRERLGPLVPFPMILREMELRSSLDADGLLAAFVAHPIAEKLKATPDLIQRLLDRGQAFLLLDGLDEIGNLEVRTALRNAIFDLAERYPSCRFLLTSRIVGYDRMPVDFARRKANIRDGESLHAWESRRYMAPFTDDQIEKLARNWYARREVADELRKTGALDLVSAIRGSEATLRLARIPNLLTLMALIHRVQRRLPHGRALLFEKISEAYLESIDAFRGIQEVDYPLAQKKRWLAYVGFQMQRRRSELNALRKNRSTSRQFIWRTR
jgi:internalin A